LLFKNAVDILFPLRYHGYLTGCDFMKIGIIGPALAGKTTLFRLLTGGTAACGKGSVPQAAAKVPDTRVETLAAIFKPKKTTFAAVEFADFPALGSGCEIAGETAMRLKACDALTIVVRAHGDPTVPWPGEPLCPDKSFFNFLNEMVLSDLCQVEALLARNKDKRRTPEETLLLESCQALLEETKPISTAHWQPSQEHILHNYAFLSSRPVLVAVNVDEEQLLAGDYEGRAALSSACEAAGYPLIEFSGRLETEISLMEKKEQAEFLDEYGLKESGITRLITAAYSLLGLCSFFTVGDDEVRAWTVHSGVTALKAAGKIHSDLERGFIRAEVIGFDEFMSLGGSFKTAREHGKLRLEGKEYPVQDGDIINVRFNV
jgi:ribosome-binding ATPase